MCVCFGADLIILYRASSSGGHSTPTKNKQTHTQQRNKENHHPSTLRKEGKKTDLALVPDQPHHRLRPRPLYRHDCRHPLLLPLAAAIPRCGGCHLVVVEPSERDTRGRGGGVVVHVGRGRGEEESGVQARAEVALGVGEVVLFMFWGWVVMWGLVDGALFKVCI